MPPQLDLGLDVLPVAGYVVIVVVVVVVVVVAIVVVLDVVSSDVVVGAEVSGLSSAPDLIVVI